MASPYQPRFATKKNTNLVDNNIEVNNSSTVADHNQDAIHNSNVVTTPIRSNNTSYFADCRIIGDDTKLYRIKLPNNYDDFINKIRVTFEIDPHENLVRTQFGISHPTSIDQVKYNEIISKLTTNLTDTIYVQIGKSEAEIQQEKQKILAKNHQNNHNNKPNNNRDNENTEDINGKAPKRRGRKSKTVEEKSSSVVGNELASDDMFNNNNGDIGDLSDSIESVPDHNAHAYNINANNKKRQKRASSITANVISSNEDIIRLKVSSAKSRSNYANTHNNIYSEPIQSSIQSSRLLPQRLVWKGDKIVDINSKQQLLPLDSLEFEFIFQLPDDSKLQFTTQITSITARKATNDASTNNPNSDHNNNANNNDGNNKEVASSIAILTREMVCDTTNNSSSLLYLPYYGYCFNTYNEPHFIFTPQEKDNDYLKTKLKRVAFLHRSKQVLQISDIFEDYLLLIIIQETNFFGFVVSPSELHNYAHEKYWDVVNNNKLHLILDLETCFIAKSSIKSEKQLPNFRADLTLSLGGQNHESLMHRPDLAQFITELSEYYEIILLTNKSQIFADSMVEQSVILKHLVEQGFIRGWVSSRSLLNGLKFNSNNPLSFIKDLLLVYPFWNQQSMHNTALIIDKSVNNWTQQCKSFIFEIMDNYDDDINIEDMTLNKYQDTIIAIHKEFWNQVNIKENGIKSHNNKTFIRPPISHAQAIQSTIIQDILLKFYDNPHQLTNNIAKPKPKPNSNNSNNSNNSVANTHINSNPNTNNPPPKLQPINNNSQTNPTNPAAILNAIPTTNNNNINQFPLNSIQQTSAPINYPNNNINHSQLPIIANHFHPNHQSVYYNQGYQIQHHIPAAAPVPALPILPIHFPTVYPYNPQVLKG